MGSGNSVELERQAQERNRLADQKRLDAEREENRRREEMEQQRLEADIRRTEEIEKIKREAENRVMEERKKIRDREEQEQRRLEAEKRLEEERQREAIRRREELEQKRLEAEIRLKEEQAKNHQAVELEKLKYLNQQEQERSKREAEKDKYRHEEKMKELGIKEKYNPDLHAVLLQKYVVDEKKLGIMATLVSDETAVSNLQTMLDKNPNIVKDFGMSDGVTGEALENALGKLELEGESAKSIKRASSSK